MVSNLQLDLQDLYQRWSGQSAERIVPFSADGSSRQYYRILGKAGSAVGAFNRDISDLDRDIYLEQDLGDETLFSVVSAIRKADGFPGRLVDLYKRVLEILPHFQITSTGRIADELTQIFTALPYAFFCCCDLGHARQVDRTMVEANKNPSEVWRAPQATSC